MTNPYIYTLEKSINVSKKTELFLEKNPILKTKINQLGWAYFNIGKIIPQTTENLLSGHFFPFVESWDELQISFNLAAFGLYKQAFAALRSGLELGLMSVYYNINDEGHKTVQDWFKSKRTLEANTPRRREIWSLLNTNNNIKNFDKKFNLHSRLDDLNFLHNYVHTKGYNYSNRLGLLKSNSQTFEEKMFVKWLYTYEEIFIIVATLHLIKYPIGIIEFEWGNKCGIDNPFPVLEKDQIRRLQDFLPNDYIVEIRKIASEDKPTQGLFKYIQGLPDMTEIDLEEQALKLDKLWIELHPEGFIGWKKQELKMIKHFNYSDEDKNKILNRMRALKKWAIENNVLSKNKRS